MNVCVYLKRKVVSLVEGMSGEKKVIRLIKCMSRGKNKRSLIS